MASDAIGDRLKRLRSWVFPTTPEYTPTTARRSWLLLLYVGRRAFLEDRCASMAAVLTLGTILSIVPVVGVALVGVGLLDPHDGERVLRKIFEGLMPSTQQARTSADGVLQFAQNVTVRNLGAWGFLVALGIAFLLYSSLENTVNRIWNVTRKRNIVVKFTMFYTLATLGPLMVLYSLQQSLVRDVSEAAWAPVLATTAGLTVLNRLLPNTAVRWDAAIAGGVVAAALFETGKNGFTFYVQQVALDTYVGLYGPLAVMPIFMLWSYLSWVTVLLGAEVAFTVHHRHSIRLQGNVNAYLDDPYAMEKAAGRTAARLLLAVADNYDRRGGGITREQLADRFRLHLGRVAQLMTQLETEGHVLEADTPLEGYVPARPLDRIRLADVLHLFDREETESIREDELTDVFAALDRARDGVAADTTYADLVAKARANRASPLREVPPNQAATTSE